MALRNFFGFAMMCITVFLGVLALTPGVAPANTYSVIAGGENWSALSFGFGLGSGPNSSLPAQGNTYVTSDHGSGAATLTAHA